MSVLLQVRSDPMESAFASPEPLNAMAAVWISKPTGITAVNAGNGVATMKSVATDNAPVGMDTKSVGEDVSM